jgi:Ca2+-binding RTX toxin-like protein
MTTLFSRWFGERPRSDRPARPTARRARPEVEALEDRRLLSRGLPGDLAVSLLQSRFGHAERWGNRAVNFRLPVTPARARLLANPPTPPVLSPLPPRPPRPPGLPPLPPPPGAGSGLPQLIGVEVLDGTILITGTRWDDRVDVNVIKESRSSFKLQIKGDNPDGSFSRLLDLPAAGTVIKFHGLDGNDQFSNSSAFDSDVDGGNGNDTLTGGDGADTIFGGAGDDVLRGGGGRDLIKGDVGDDQILGGAGNDVLEGGAGQDSVGGEAGHDIVYGDGDDDDLDGGPGNDFVRGHDGNDTLHGGDGNDTLWGGQGNDYLGATLGKNEAGNDRLAGEDGEDTVRGGTGNDWLWGGQGNDSLGAQVIERPGTWPAGFEDKIRYSGSRMVRFTQTDAPEFRIWFEDGNDLLFGGAGNDTMTGGWGDDLLSGDTGNDLMGDAIQNFFVGRRARYVAVGEPGDDYLFGGPDDDTLFAGTGADRVYGDGGTDYLHSGANYIAGEGCEDNGTHGDHKPQDSVVDYLYGGSGFGDEALYYRNWGSTRDKWNAGSEDIAFEIIVQVANAITDF